MSVSSTSMVLGRACGRRGVAMLLVLVAMVVAVVLTSAAIVSREVSPAIGSNATASVSTAWSAESAANYAVGVLAGGFDWESAIGPDGTLVDAMVIGAASVHVTLMDLEGNVPDSSDRDLIMTAVATVDGISTTVRRMISLGAPGDPIDAIDPRLGEFTVLGVASLTVENGGRLGVWPLSPEAGLRPQVKLGTRFVSASDLDVRLESALGPVEMHVDISGDAGLVSEVAGSGYALQWQMPLPIPVFVEAVPAGVLAAVPHLGDLEPASGASVAVGGGEYDQIRVLDGATATIDGSVVRCDRFEIDGATVRIVGDVSIFVAGEFRVRNGGSLVLVGGDARVTVYLCDDLIVEGGAQFGVAESDVGRAASALGTWVSPDRVRILEVPVAQGGTGVMGVIISDSSTVVAAMHAPGADFDLLLGATLIGRVTASHVVVGATATVWYCPTLDSRVGFTNPEGPLYESDFSANALVEEALEEALSSGATTMEQFMTSLHERYYVLVNEQPLGEADGGGVGMTVQTTSHLFTGMTGIQ